MELIRDLSIRNFKSLENVQISGCKRYNLFVGRPNVGKSNILEALSLFSIPYIAPSNITLSELFRIDQHLSTLFYNGDMSKDMSIEAGSYKCVVHYENASSIAISLSLAGNSQTLRLVDLKLEKPAADYPVFKPYVYGKHTNGHAVNMPFLCPICGDNLMQVLKGNDELRNDIVRQLSSYNLKLVLDTATQEIKIMKPLDDSTSFIIPFSAMADSLKRLLFYKAAVMSNYDSVLMLEEPEAHSYPPYIVKVIQTMLSADDNQYFITTHSPYVINEFLENNADVAVFIVDYKDGKTAVRGLTDDEITQVYEAGIDLFFNTEFFD